MMDNNLESTINKIGYEIVKNKIVDENQINKMIGVLSNDGVYAWWVYALKELKTNSIFLCDCIFYLNNTPSLITNLIKLNNISDIHNVAVKIIELTKDFDRNKKEIEKKFKDWQDLMSKNFQALSNNLDDLLFFREILEKVLIYARYHAKTMGDS